MNAKTMLKRVDWIKTISTLAILVGVFLVAYELRQTRELNLAQLASEGMLITSQGRIALWGDEPLETLAKTCSEEPLSRKEAMFFHFYYAEQFGKARRLKFVQEAHPEYDWIPEARSILRIGIFDSLRGRRWWEAISTSYDPEM